MSQEELLRNGISQISGGKRIRRGERSIFRRRKGSCSSKSKINEESESSQKESAQIKNTDTEREKKVHVDVVI